MQVVVPNKNSLGYTLLAALALAFASLGDAFLYAYLPANFHSIGLSAFWVGLVLSVNRFTRLFLNSWVAFYLGKYGIKTITIFATILAVITTLSYGFVVSGFIWVIVRILWGITFSTLRLTSLMYAMQHPKKGFSLGLNKSIIALGPVLSLFIAPVLLNHFDRTIVFTLLGALTAIGIIMAMLLLTLQH
jgi:MFS transporter, DHA1 family, multidrug resistance protein